MLKYTTAVVAFLSYATAIAPGDPDFVDGCTLNLPTLTPDMDYEQCQDKITTLKSEVSALISDNLNAASCKTVKIDEFNALPNPDKWDYDG